MENKFNIGELDTEIKIIEMVQTVGSQGQKTWRAVHCEHAFAKVERDVVESVGDSNFEAENSLVVTCYKDPRLTTRWRVEIEGKVYEIRSIDTISRTSPVCTLTLRSIDG